MRTTRTPRPVLVLAGGVLALVLAGCGSDAAEPDAGSAAQAPTTEEDPAAEDTGEPADDESTDGEPTDAASTDAASTDGESMDGESMDDEPVDAGTSEAEVAIRDDDGFAFAPTEVTVAAGDTVTWMHEGRVTHTVTAEDGSFASGNLAAGDTFEMTFDEPGSYPYFCEFHGSMRGTVTVE
jgi:plastocyanin